VLILVNWVNTAILSAAFMAGVNILDSHLVSKRMPSLRAFLLPVSAVHLIYAFLLFTLFPLPEGTDTWPVLAAVVSGVLRTAAAIIMLDSLKREEVSRVVPIVYAYPIFVAIMAVPLLGESLGWLEWLAIVIVVSGAVMVSMGQSPSGSIVWHGKLLLLFGCGLLFAMADIASKYALAYISFWNMFCISAFCMSSIFLLVSIRPGIIRQLISMEQKSSAIGLLVLDETLVVIGIVLSFWALERGPVSLVATIAGSRPMFVLIFTIVLSRLLPTFLKWHFSKRMLALRLVATAMVVGGITIIQLCG